MPPAAPRDMVRAVFDSVGELGGDPGFRGCPLVNAAAEYPDPDHPVPRAVDNHRRWFRELLLDLLAADGQADPERTADMLVALKDGLLVGSYLDGPSLRSLVREAVTRLLDGPPPGSPAGTGGPAGECGPPAPAAR